MLNPLPAKCRAIAFPIRIAPPVIIAVGIFIPFLAYDIIVWHLTSKFLLNPPKFRALFEQVGSYFFEQETML